MAGERRVDILIKARDEASKVFENISKRALPDFAKSVAQFAAGFASVAAVEEVLRRSVTAAIEAEKATAGLAAALRAQGQASLGTLPYLKAHAEALARVSMADDEAVQGAQKILVSLGQLRGQALDRATQAALDLAAGLGIDLAEAATMIAKAAQGSVTAFSKLGFEFQKNATDAEKLDAVLAGVQQRFGGMAAAELGTMAGQIHELSEAFGELLETLGTKLVTGAGNVSALTRALQDLNTEANDERAMGFWKSLGLILAGTIGGKGITSGVSPFAIIAADAARARSETEGNAKAIAEIGRATGPLADWANGYAEALAKAARAAADLAGTLSAEASRVGNLPAPGSRPFDSALPSSDLDALQKGIADREGNAVQQQIDQLIKSLTAAGDPLKGMIDGFIALGEEIDTVTVKGEDFALVMQNAMMADALQAAAGAAAELAGLMVDAAFGAKVSWEDAIRSILAGLAKAIIQAAILKAIGIAVGFSGGGVVGGGGGGVSPSGFASNGGVVYAAGGLFTPRGTDTVPAMLTPGEIVLPRGVSHEILGGRASVVSNGGGRPVYLTINALDGVSVERVLTANPRALANALEHMDGRGY